MKKLQHALLIVLAAITMASCGNDVIYNETRTFDNETWLRQQPETFDFEVSNIEDCYNIYVTFRLDTADLRGNDLPLINNLYTEEGERRMWYGSIHLRNADGTWLHKLEGKYVVGEQKIREYFFFNAKGMHTLEIGQGTSRYEIHGVGSFGVRIEKAKLVYPE